MLYAYGGWNDAVFVAADVREPKRNMPRALALGTLLIAGLYILVNAAFVSSLGFAGIRGSRTPAADVLGLWLGNRGVTGMSLMVMVSALGAVSGLILAGCRLHASVGADYRIFAWLGRWNARLNAPVYSLVTQALVSVLLILAVGTESGRNAVDRSVTTVGLPALAVERVSRRLRHARGRHVPLVLVLLSADGHFAVGAALQRPRAAGLSGAPLSGRAADLHRGQRLHAVREHGLCEGAVADGPRAARARRAAVPY